MGSWYKRNKLAIDAAKLTNELQISAWAMVVTITTKENPTTWPDAGKGWGYIHPPVNVLKISGVVPADPVYDTETMYACMPNNWN